MDKKILIGLHDEGLANSTSIFARIRGYQPFIAPDLNELIAEAKDREYQRVIMDINFGFPFSLDVLPSFRVYEVLKPRIYLGLVRFLAISGNYETVRLAKNRGIPAEDKSDVNLSDFLKE